MPHRELDPNDLAEEGYFVPHNAGPEHHLLSGLPPGSFLSRIRAVFARPGERPHVQNLTCAVTPDKAVFLYLDGRFTQYHMLNASACCKARQNRNKACGRHHGR